VPPKKAACHSIWNTDLRTTASEKNDVTTSCTGTLGSRCNRGNLSNSSNRNCSLDHPVIIQPKQVQGQNEGDQKKIQKGISSLVDYYAFLRWCVNTLQATRDYEFIYSTMIRNEKNELFIQWNLTSWSISAARDFTALPISVQILWILYGSLIFLPWSVLCTICVVCDGIPKRAAAIGTVQGMTT
jgi:hypothetical protein